MRALSPEAPHQTSSRSHSELVLMCTRAPVRMGSSCRHNDTITTLPTCLPSQHMHPFRTQSILGPINISSSQNFVCKTANQPPHNQAHTHKGENIHSMGKMSVQLSNRYAHSNLPTHPLGLARSVVQRQPCRLRPHRYGCKAVIVPSEILTRPRVSQTHLNTPQNCTAFCFISLHQRSDREKRMEESALC